MRRSSYRRGIGGAGNNLLQPLTFPPASLPGTDDNLLQLAFRRVSSGFGGGDDDAVRTHLKDAEASAETWKSIKDPLLRACLKHRVDDKEGLATAVEALRNLESPALADLLFAASHAIQAADYEQAAKDTIKASYLPMGSQAKRSRRSSVSTSS